MSVAISQPNQLWEINGYSAAASWAISVWEGLIRLDDEVDFIWPMAHTAYIKWLYFFGKYFALAVQTGVLGIQVVYLANHSMSTQYCRMYRALEMTAITLLLLCLDIVLLLRIYALYGRHAWSCVFATCVVLVECVTMVVSVVLTIPTEIYDSACILIEIPKLTFAFVAVSFISQTILVWLTYRKRERVVQPKSSIAYVTIRDGVLVFVCITAFLVILFILILHNNPVATLAIFWCPMIISVAMCRMILNLQRVPHAESSQQFSTDVWGLDANSDSLLLSDASFQPRLAW